MTGRKAGSGICGLAKVGYGLPVSVRLPLFAAAMIFLAAVASTQTAIFIMTSQADRQLEAMGKVYLDGLSAALLPHIRSGDAEAISATLRQALDFHDGIVDRRLALVLPGSGDVIEVWRDRDQAVDPLPDDIIKTSEGFTNRNGSIWVWRSLGGEKAPQGTVVAKLDIAPFEAERTFYRWLLILLDLAFSGTCAVIGYFLVRRIQRPVATVARYLQDAASGTIHKVPETEIPRNDPKASDMMRAFNTMAAALDEREKMIDHIAEQQRQADLGRLAATIAHEVRNPLGGMRTAIGTLRRFGHDAEPREAAVTFLDRGVLALEQVVTATLESYRSRPDWRPLTTQDFQDLRLLVEADAKARKISVKLDLAIAEMVSVPALEVRQILLNLLLNAVRASKPSGTVNLSARVRNQDLMITVEDHGKGFDSELLSSIDAGDNLPRAGIGVSVVVRLVQQLNGQVSIESSPHTGTRIHLTFPLTPREPRC